MFLSEILRTKIKCRNQKLNFFFGTFFRHKNVFNFQYVRPDSHVILTSSQNTLAAKSLKVWKQLLKLYCKLWENKYKLLQNRFVSFNSFFNGNFPNHIYRFTLYPNYITASHCIRIIYTALVSIQIIYIHISPHFVLESYIPPL